jgi:large subunit ribosomal protein L24
MKSSKARKQRKAFFNAPLHQRRKQIGSHLEENLLLKYDKRRLPIVQGDTVKIMRGAFKGHENKVTSILLKKHLVEIEGVTITKADGKQVAQPVHPSNLLITKLNLTDKWRRQRLEEGLSTETKKEIEKEATAQIKQVEEERRAEEERRKQEEAEAKAKEEEESTEEATEPEPKEETKPAKTEGKKTESTKTPTKKEPVKEKPKKTTKTTEEKKPSEKKETSKEKKSPQKKEPKADASKEKKEKQSDKEKEDKK